MRFQDFWKAFGAVENGCGRRRLRADYAAAAGAAGGRERALRRNHSGGRRGCYGRAGVRADFRRHPEAAAGSFGGGALDSGRRRQFSVEQAQQVAEMAAERMTAACGVRPRCSEERGRPNGSRRSSRSPGARGCGWWRMRARARGRNGVGRAQLGAERSGTGSGGARRGVEAAVCAADIPLKFV